MFITISKKKPTMIDPPPPEKKKKENPSSQKQRQIVWVSVFCGYVNSFMNGAGTENRN